MEDISIEALWKEVLQGCEKRKQEKGELQNLRQKVKGLKALQPKPGEILSPQELKQRLEAMFAILT